MKYVLVITAVVLALTFSSSLQARTKWKGPWYLRGASECKEVTLDRKGRTDPSVYPKAVVEKKDKDLFLTVEGSGKKYSYAMHKQDISSFNLELISVGPNQSLPDIGKTPLEGVYSGFFKRFVDCQTK